MLDIRFNNNKEFMAAHREEYIQKVRDPYYQLIAALTPTMLQIDPGMETRPAKCLSRIFRDTRFSKDKSPYRDHHWVAFRHGGIPKERAPLFWLEIRLEQVNWGLGFWGENREAMRILRHRMLRTPNEFIAFNQTFSTHHFVLSGDTYKRIAIPDDLHPEVATWYTRKELLVGKSKVDPSIIFSAKFADTLINDFLALAPLYQLMQNSYELAIGGGDVTSCINI